MNKLACLLGALTLLSAAPAFAADVRVSAYIDGGAVEYRDYERPRHERHRHNHPRRHARHVRYYETHYVPGYWREPAAVYYRPAYVYDYGYDEAPRHHHDRHCHH